MTTRRLWIVAAAAPAVVAVAFGALGRSSDCNLDPSTGGGLLVFLALLLAWIASIVVATLAVYRFLRARGTIVAVVSGFLGGVVLYGLFLGPMVWLGIVSVFCPV